MKKILDEFKQEIRNYINIVHENWSCKNEKVADRRPYEEKIIAAFRKIPKKERAKNLLLFLKTMAKPVRDDRLTSRRCEFALGLVKEMEEIK